MGRPRTFDLDDALDAAMALFWREGYESAGLTELLEVMGIQRGSLYKAFGSKHGLFLAVLERYRRTEVDPGLDYLANGPGRGADRIREAMVSGAESNRGIGCLLCNTAAGPAAHDPDIRDAVNAQFDLIRDAFAAALRDGETGNDAQITVRADQLAREYMGRQIGARSQWRPAGSGI